MLQNPLLSAGIACADPETASAIPVSTLAPGGQAQLLRRPGSIRLVVSARTERSCLANGTGLEPPGPEAPAEAQLPRPRTSTSVQNVAVGRASKAAKSGRLL